MLITKVQREQLLKNGCLSQEENDKHDHKPVVKLFTPDTQATWLLTELYPDDPNIAFGLCDLGMGFPELGDVSISEFEALRGSAGLPVERDLHFTADKTISEYAPDAHEAQYISPSLSVFSGIFQKIGHFSNSKKYILNTINKIKFPFSSK